MIDLHERLSEFSFGYGVTKEVEGLLATVGVHATPFFPNLKHENELGFDVGFKAKGAVIALQFKLGSELKKFRASSTMKVMPPLGRPFWRFFVDTGGDQFKMLREYEGKGAQVFYVAPRFTSWEEYDTAFYDGVVLDKSLIVTPNDIENKLFFSDPPAVIGVHRVVYDRSDSYVCSEPLQLDEIKKADLVEKIASKADSTRDLGTQLEEMFSARKAERSSQRRREDNILNSANSREIGLMNILALDALTHGAQLLFASKDGAKA